MVEIEQDDDGRVDKSWEEIQERIAELVEEAKNGG